MTASNAISSRTRPGADSASGSAGSSSSTAERFELSGPSIVLDPAVHAYRSDLADIALAGQLFAPHYVRPVFRRAAVAVAVREAPGIDSPAVAQLDAGAEFALLDALKGWAWGYCRATHRVGYVPEADLVA